MKKELTIYDIASEFKVAPSTVSRALKDHYSIGKNTKRKIREFAADKGYRPLAIRRIRTLGLIVPRVDDPVMASVISGIEQVAAENGINVIISQSLGHYENEKLCAKRLCETQIGGLIVSLAPDTSNADHIMEFTKNNIPVVLIDRKLDGFNSGAVMVDYYTSSFLATSQLINHGCRRIAFIGEPLTGKVYEEKLKGYLQSLRAHSVDRDENLIIARETLSVTQGYTYAMELLNLSAPPDAIFCDNDTTAVGVVQYAKSKGICIPRELSVIGFNDEPVSRMMNPALSTVAHPGIEMGSTAVQLILDRNIHEKRLKTIVLNPKLVQRQSSLKNVQMAVL